MQICAGLAAAHAAGLVHRDVKPQNLLVGSDGVLKLGDFGIAVGDEGTRLTLAGTVLGTAGYLAPEQARGEQVTAAADLYAVGAVLYELLTAEPSRTVGSLAELGSDDGFQPLRPRSSRARCSARTRRGGDRLSGGQARGQARFGRSTREAARSGRIRGGHALAAGRPGAARNRDPRPAGAPRSTVDRRGVSPLPRPSSLRRSSDSWRHLS